MLDHVLSFPKVFIQPKVLQNKYCFCCIKGSNVIFDTTFRQYFLNVILLYDYIYFLILINTVDTLEYLL